MHLRTDPKSYERNFWGLLYFDSNKILSLKTFSYFSNFM